MVYESRPGETFLLGASTWRIEDITHERVVVTPAPGQPGKMPFWHGDGPGRPLELGRALGEFVRTIRSAAAGRGAGHAAGRDHDLDALAAANLLAYLDEQAEACGGVVPDDRTIVVERFRDEIGDWRVCVHTPFGAQVHAPWGMALQARLAERWGVDVELMWSDDGIVLRLPEAVDEFPLDELVDRPGRDRRAGHRPAPRPSMFAGRFRECAARALLLPRRRPDRRTPLWQQRQRAADLLAVAARYPDFPILLETTRECLNDVFDLPALREVLTDLRARRGADGRRSTPPGPRPFAQSLLFGWIAVYMYEGDAPLAERRAAALALDRDLLRELLGAEELRELRRPGGARRPRARAAAPGRRPSGPRRRRGPRPAPRAGAARRGGRSRPAATRPTRRGVRARSSGWRRRRSSRERRAIAVCVAGEAPRRGGRGRRPPARRPRRGPAPGPARRVHRAGRATPSTTSSPASPAPTARSPPPRSPARYGVGADRVLPVLERLEADGPGRAAASSAPTAIEREWCDDDVLRQLRRRSLAALRREVEPVDGEALARFLPGVAGRRVDPPRPRRRGRGGRGRSRALALPASVLEADVLAARVERLPGRRPRRAVHRGRGGVGGCRRRRRRRRPRPAAVPRPGGAAGGAAPRPGARRDRRRPTANRSARRGEPGAARPPRRAGGVVLARPGRRGPGGRPALRRRHRARRAVGAGVGGPGHQRLARRRCGPVASGGRRTAAPRRSRGGPGRRRARRRRSAVARPRSPGLGSLSRLGPPAGGGSLVAGRRRCSSPAPTPTEAAHALALQLLERHGVLTREAVLAEGVEGGFAAVYPVLKALEERGQVRRGYFVAGPGRGAVRPGRGGRPAPPAPATRTPTGSPRCVLAATDPAQPYGAALPWPTSAGRPGPGRRGAGRAGRRAPRSPTSSGAVGAWSRSRRPPTTRAGRRRWPGWSAGGRWRRLEIARIDGEPAAESPLADELRAAGFADGYRGLVLGGAEGGRVPEGDTIHRTAARLRPALVGRPLVRFEAHRWPAPWPPPGTLVTDGRGAGQAPAGLTSPRAGCCRPTCA